MKKIDKMDKVEVAGTIAAYVLLGLFVGFGVLFPIVEIFKLFSGG